MIEDTGNHERAANDKLIIKSCRTSAGQLATIAIRNQLRPHNLARTEALCRRSEKAQMGAYRLEAYGTFCAAHLCASLCCGFPFIRPQVLTFHWGTQRSRRKNFRRER